MNLHLFFHLMTVTEDIVEQGAGLLSQASTRLFPALELCSASGHVCSWHNADQRDQSLQCQLLTKAEMRLSARRT
ncbi:MAG TPA: hypothetical protein VM468_13880, partial [Mycoplana sp.]|nr:hypothetical protein [Mycoplana sp.]